MEACLLSCHARFHSLASLLSVRGWSHCLGSCLALRKNRCDWLDQRRAHGPAQTNAEKTSLLVQTKFPCPLFLSSRCCLAKAYFYWQIFASAALQHSQFSQEHRCGSGCPLRSGADAGSCFDYHPPPALVSRARLGCLTAKLRSDR